jgi:hypothetical protein
MANALYDPVAEPQGYAAGPLPDRSPIVLPWVEELQGTNAASVRRAVASF